MAYDGKLLAAARAELEKIREENRNEQMRRTRRVYELVPEIAGIDRKLQGHMVQLVRLTIGKASDMAERIAELEKENLSLQARRAELLTAHGWGMDYLDDIYSCHECHDSGSVNGHMCDCMKGLYNKALSLELGSLLKHGDECFDNFDLGLYANVPAPGQSISPRAVMQRVFEACRKFADNFPNVGANLLMQGGPGLGKTYLSACIARTVADKGLSVCYETAVAALDAFEQQKFSRDSAEGLSAAAKVQRMSDCDLMILDDLGTEMLTPMSQSALYTLINNRLVRGRKTIISTNLSDTELEKRYSPQINSRLAGEFLHLPFAGEDIRRMKKGV